MRLIFIVFLFLFAPFLSLAQSGDQLAQDPKLAAAVNKIVAASDKANGHNAAFDYLIVLGGSVPNLDYDDFTSPVRILGTLDMHGDLVEWNLTENRSLFGDKVTMTMTLNNKDAYTLVFDLRAKDQRLVLKDIDIKGLKTTDPNAGYKLLSNLFNFVRNVQVSSRRQVQQAATVNDPTKHTSNDPKRNAAITKVVGVLTGSGSMKPEYDLPIILESADKMIPTNVSVLQYIALRDVNADLRDWNIKLDQRNTGTWILLEELVKTGTLTMEFQIVEKGAQLKQAAMDGVPYSDDEMVVTAFVNLKPAMQGF